MKDKDKTKGQLMCEWIELHQRITELEESGTKRKGAEEMAREGEERLRVALEAAQMAIWDWDVLTGKVIGSDNLELLFGLAPGTMDRAYDAFFESIHPEDRELVTQAWNHAIQEGTDYNIEFRVIWPDGAVHWMAEKGRVFYDETGRIVRIVRAYTDITERKRTEEKLRRQNEYLNALHETTLAIMNRRELADLFEAIITRARMLTGTPQGFIALVEPGEAEIKIEVSVGVESSNFLGYRLKPGQGLIGKVWQTGQPMVVNNYPNWPGRVADSNFNIFRAALAVPLKSGSQVIGVVGLSHLEEGRTFGDDEMVLLSRFAELASIALDNARLYASAQQELAERRRAEEILRDSEERYRLLFESNPHPMWVYDFETLAFLAINDAAVLHYGYSREEFLSMTIRDFRLPGEVPPLLNHLSKIITEVNWMGTWKHRKKDGTLIDVEVTSRPLIFGGRPARLVLANDITERKRAEEEIRRLNEELEQRVIERTAELQAANKELEAFSYSVSHDLRAPLRAIDGFSRILLEEYAPQLAPQAQEYLQLIRNNTQQMGHLVDDLLAFSRLSRQPIKKQPVAPADLVHQALRDLHNEQEGRHVEIIIDNLPICEADPALLKQVFVNLISNALKFTRRQEVAVIEIGCRGDDREPSERVYFVKDNGAGFNMKYANKLFGVFQRLHRAEEYEGTGVGLAIVQRIINRHGGRVWAEAEVNKGATFYFILP